MFTAQRLCQGSALAWVAPAHVAKNRSDSGNPSREERNLPHYAVALLFMRVAEFGVRLRVIVGAVNVKT